MSATATETALFLHQFEAKSSPTSVDSEKGVIYGVSLITSGISARGHTLCHPDDKDLPVELQRQLGLEIDKTTLEQMLECAEQKKKLPVKWNHKTGADAVSGYLKNFRIEGNKLLGDWHLLKSHERYKHALELATEMPESLGLSTSFRGKDEVVGERAFARCKELVSADLVASPAANPDGFFEEIVAVVDRGPDGMGKPNTTPGAALDPAKEFSLADVMAGLSSMSKRFDGIEARVTGFETALAEATNFEEEEDDDEDLDDGAGLTEFANGEEAISYLAERLASIEDAAQREKSERAFAAFEEKTNALVELNEQLLVENQVMSEAIAEFMDKTGAVVEFKAAPDGAGYVHALSVPETDGRAPISDFETRVAELVASGKADTEAIRLSMKEDPKRYQRHLQAIGVVARRL